MAFDHNERTKNWAAPSIKSHQPPALHPSRATSLLYVMAPPFVTNLIDRVPGYTVPFRSIRQAPWPVTALPKFWFRQDAKMTVTACFFRQIGKIFEDFCGIYVKIVLLSWFYSNGKKHPLDCSGNFFSIFMRFIYDFFNGFSSWPKLLWPPWLFGVWKWPVTCDCWIDWNGIVFLRVIDG